MTFFLDNFDYRINILLTFFLCFRFYHNSYHWLCTTFTNKDSSWMIARSVFDALGAKTYVINAQPDGLNINMNAGSTHIEVLQKFVKENHLNGRKDSVSGCCIFTKIWYRMDIVLAVNSQDILFSVNMQQPETESFRPLR